MTPPDALIGIARVSTEKQADARRAGLDRQIEAIRQIAQAQGVSKDRLTIIPLQDVGGSDVGQTPEWQNKVLPRLADPGVHLAVDAVDRIIRPDGYDFGVLATLQALGTRVYTPGGAADLRTPDGFMAAGMRALLGGLEKLEFKRRVHRAREVKRRRGEWCTGPHTLPRGIAYDFETTEWGYDDKAHEVKRIYELFVREGRSLRETADEIGMSSEGVRNLLEQPMYRGVWVVDTKAGFEAVMRHDGRQPTRRRVKRAPENVIETRIFGGEGQPRQLIDDPTWHAAQELLTRNRKRRRRARRNSHEHIWASKYLFSGLGDHGAFEFALGEPPVRRRLHTVYGVTVKGGCGFAYRCRCYSNAEIPGCGLPQMQAVEVNRAIDRLMLSICRSKRFQRDVIDAAVEAAGGEEITAERTRLEEQIKKAEKKRARVLEGFEAGLYTAREAVERREKVDDEIRKVTDQLNALAPRDPQAEKEATRRHFESIEMWDSAWSRDQKTAWMKRYLGGVLIDTEGVTGMILRLPAADGTIDERTHLFRATWAQLGLEYDPGDREGRAAVRRAEEGVFQTGDVCKALGFTYNKVAYLLRAGKIEKATGRLPTGKKFWDRAAFEKAVEQGKALSES